MADKQRTETIPASARFADRDGNITGDIEQALPVDLAFNVGNHALSGIIERFSAR